MPPVIKRFEGGKPDKVRKVKVVETGNGKVLFWSVKDRGDELHSPVKFCVYRFESKRDIDLDRPSALIKVNSSKIPRHSNIVPKSQPQKAKSADDLSVATAGSFFISKTKRELKWSGT